MLNKYIDQPSSKRSILLHTQVELLTAWLDVWKQWFNRMQSEKTVTHVTVKWNNALEVAFKTDVALRSHGDLPEGFREWMLQLTKTLYDFFHVKAATHPYLSQVRATFAVECSEAKEAEEADVDASIPSLRPSPQPSVRARSPQPVHGKRSASEAQETSQSRKRRIITPDFDADPDLVAFQDSSTRYRGVRSPTLIASGGFGKIFAVETPCDCTFLSGKKRYNQLILKAIPRTGSFADEDLSLLPSRKHVNCRKYTAEFIEFLNQTTTEEASQSEQIFMMSLREIKFLWAVESLRVTPKVHDVFLFPRHAESDGTLKSDLLILTMDRALGGDLESFMKETLDHRSLPLSFIRDIAKQMIHLVHKIHTASIVHADLKPLNIVLSLKSKPDGMLSVAETKSKLVKCVDDNGVKVQLIDFGIAEDVSPHTSPGASSSSLHQPTTTIQRDVAIGSMAYLAPESIKTSHSSGKQVFSRKLDVWALGAILWRLIFKRSVVCSARKIDAVEPTVDEIIPFVYDSDLMTHLKVPIIDRRLISEVVESSNPRASVRYETGVRDLINLLGKCLTLDPKLRSPTSELVCHAFLHPLVGLDEIEEYFRLKEKEQQKQGRDRIDLNAMRKEMMNYYGY
eukprot:GHVH01003591.1.p1 GENE.GHVH01003591.1~~GHVH01003591.1.p1  ORF type:complete len:625 (+),score=105.08 GHVH01003591.1:791-2665(+)